MAHAQILVVEDESITILQRIQRVGIEQFSNHRDKRGQVVGEPPQ